MRSLIKYVYTFTTIIGAVMGMVIAWVVLLDTEEDTNG
jgi:hypothetical protein